MDWRIAYILPRKLHFGPEQATSVDLCVHDLVRFSRYRATTQVFCPQIDRPFADVKTVMMRRRGAFGNFGRAFYLARELSRQNIDLAIVEHHLPMAAMIAAMTRKPVLFHSHVYEPSRASRFDRQVQSLKLAAFAGIVLVSNSCAQQFKADFPKIKAPVGVVFNGLDMAEWIADGPKDRMILTVGRAIPQKGLTEALDALLRVLAVESGWTARFILSDPGDDASYLHGLQAAAAAMPDQICIETCRPHAEVKANWARAAIGVAPSQGAESFGRTALEAMASGAALITSGLGGLSEVCGACALIIDPDSPASIEQALRTLIRQPELRAKLAREGRQRAQALYDIRSAAKSMDDFIDGVLAGRG